MTAEERLRDLERKLKAAREAQREALEDWRALLNFGKFASNLVSASVRVAFATDKAESLADEFEDAQNEAHREELRRIQEYA